jgi:branched-chain amino acid transport system ATP-binding protein
MAALTALAAARTMTILLVEQRIKAALDFADDVIILERGRIVWHGMPGTLAAEPKLVERLLGVGP